MNSSSDSKDYEKVALENLRIGIRYFIGQLGKMGLVQVIREVVYILQDEGYNGFSTLLESLKDYSLEEEDTAPVDVQRTWRRVARQIGYVIQETLMKGRQLP